MVAEQPDYPEGLCLLGIADAALGNKEDAIREGRRAVELLPVSKDAIRGPLLIQYLALIYAWTGEKDLALEQLSIAAGLPCRLSYGYLRLHPYWDPLRGDPRFETSDGWQRNECCSGQQPGNLAKCPTNQIPFPMKFTSSSWKFPRALGFR